MESHRKILHLDLDAFFCAVEELLHPELRGRPFAVGGRPDERGVVSSCSYAARQFGVRSALPMGQALRLCPGLLVVSPTYSAYKDMSTEVMAILHDQTGLVEQLSIDEAFMDLSDLPQPGIELARGLQNSIRERLNLPCSLGIATNKLIAKTATDVGKSRHRGPTPPCSILEVLPGQEAAFLAPLPAQALWGIGPKTAARLSELGLRTIGDLAVLPEAVLLRQFGKNGYDIARHARGIDDRPVVSEHATRSISQEITYDRDVSNLSMLTNTLRELSEGVARDLREKSLCAGTIRLKLRWPDFTTISRQVSFAQPVDQDGIIYQAALDLFHSVWSAGHPVRLIGVGAARLSEHAHQLSLWDTPDQKERRLLDALDDLRDRFGDDVVRRGRNLKPPPPSGPRLPGSKAKD